MALRVAIICGMAFEAELLRRNNLDDVADIIYGLDSKKLIHDIQNAVANGASHLISFGTAAGIDPAVSSGAIILASSVSFDEPSTLQSTTPSTTPSTIPSMAQHWLETDQVFAQSLALLLRDALQKPMAGVDAAISSVAQKHALWETFGVAAADMESHHIARIAEEHHLPFTVLRIVLDDANTTLPPAAMVATKPDGTIAFSRLIASLLLKPLQIPAMLRLGKQHSSAKASLVHSARLLSRALRSSR